MGVAASRRVVELAAIKFIRMWNIWPNNAEHRGVLTRCLTAATYLPAMVLALCGILRTRYQLWPAAVCWLPAVYLTLLHLIFVSSIRYREPPMLALLVFAAAALTRGGRPSPARVRAILLAIVQVVGAAGGSGGGGRCVVVLPALRR